MTTCKFILPLLLIIPAIATSQNNASISYQQALANCRNLIEENQKAYPDSFIYTGPECLIGASVPEFSATAIDGKEISYAYFKGKMTILNFWLLSCPPCIAETPGFNKIMDKYGHDRFNYLAITLENEKDIRHYLSNNAWGFSQIPSATAIIFDVFNARWGYPTTFVINEDAVIIAAFSGGKSDASAPKELEDTLSEIIDKALR